MQNDIIMAILPAYIEPNALLTMTYQHSNFPRRSLLNMALTHVYRCSMLGILGFSSPMVFADSEFVASDVALPINETADFSEDISTTEDITASSTMSRVASPKIDESSARTRPNFTPNEAQQKSLDRLTEYYHIISSNDLDNSNAIEHITIDDNHIDNQAKLTNELKNITKSVSDNLLGKTAKEPLCQGAWIYPQTQKQDKPAQQDDKTLYATADYGYYDNSSYAEFTGDVQVNQGHRQINADKVVVNLQDGIALAQGNVMVLNSTENPAQDGLISIANEVAYQSDSSKATAKDVAFANVALQAHGYAKQLNKVDESHYEIDDVMFTTCSPDNPTWQINAKSLDINTDTGRGEVRNATFKIKDKPIFYLPYFNFPINDKRASGFLLPKAGFSNDGGLRVQTPYYFNLAPNYDVTLTPTIFTNRNPMLNGEFRYLTEQFGQAQLQASFLPQDRRYYDEDRYRVQFDHHWQSKKHPTLSVHGLYQQVSDSAYFDDFDNLGLEHNHLNLPRRLQADYYNDFLTASAKIETFQTVDKNILDKDKPYQRLPHISLKYRLPEFENLQITGVSDFAYFKRPIYDNSAPTQSGGRFYNKISASYPIRHTWGYITPTASLQHIYTQYDEESSLVNNFNSSNKNQFVFVPEFSLDMGLNFYKAGSPFKWQDFGGYQLLSPRLKYIYAPFKDQSNVPNFNTRLASLNFPQLYENSWFLGYDRLADNNHITPSVNYRYVDSEGFTRLDANIGQQFFLDDINVGLEQATSLNAKSSGTVIQLSSQPRHDFWLDFDGAINDNGSLNYYNAQLRYQPNNNALYNLGFIKRRPHIIGQKELSAMTASAIFPLSQNWGFIGAVQYDNIKNRYNDVLVGLKHDNCCYGFSVYGRSYYNEFDDKLNHAIMAEISLNSVFRPNQGKLSSLMNERVLGINQLNYF